MDERAQQILLRGMAITLVLLYMAIFGSALWKYVQTADITNSTWEILLIVLIPTSILWFSRKDGSLLIPKLKSGEPVPTTSDSFAKRKRRTSYAWNALGFTIVIFILTVLDASLIQKEWIYFSFSTAWTKQANILATLVLEWMITFITFLAIIYVWGEWSVRRYEKKMKELEEVDE